MPLEAAALRCLIVGLLFVPAFVALPAVADDAEELEAMIERIIALRGSVEDLDNDLDARRSEHESRMSSLARREGQLDAERQRAQRNVDKLEERLDGLRTEVAEAGVENETLVPVLEDALAGARERVEAGMPFKRDERIAALDELERQLAGEVLDPPRVANRLWSFHADELRLAGESGLFRQVVEIDDEERLVDVVRLGMMMMYFRSDDGRYGQAVRANGEWSFRTTDDRDDHRRIDALFDQMRKGIRTGFFQLPASFDLTETQ